MNNFKERLQQIMKEKNISQSELSKRTGIGRNSISDYLKGKYEAKQDKVFILANALNVNEAWLMGFDIKKNKDLPSTDITTLYDKLTPPRQKVVLTTAETQLEEQQQEKSSDNVISPDFINGNTKDYTECNEVDVAGILAAGRGTLNFDKSKPIKTVNVAVDEIPDKYDLTFQISGDSMEPGFKDGELVYVDTLSPFKNKKVYAVEVNKEAYIKKVYRDGKTYTLVSLNNEKNKNGDRLFPEITVTENDDFYIIGRIV